MLTDNNPLYHEKSLAERTKVAPVPTLRRLPKYLEYLRNIRVAADAHISCTQIAGALELVPTQVRKDLATTGIVGKPKKGYPVYALIQAIEDFLGWNTPQDAFLVGSGALGTAILGYEGFRNNGLNIVAAFDNDSVKIGTRIRGVEVMSLEKLPELAKRMNIQIGVMTMPSQYAQQIADLLISGGIKAIWNFTPSLVVVDDDIILENAQLASSFAVLSSRLRSKSHLPVKH